MYSAVQSTLLLYLKLTTTLKVLLVHKKNFKVDSERKDMKVSTIYSKASLLCASLGISDRRFNISYERNVHG